MFRILGKSKIAFLLAILFGISLFFFRSGSRYSNLFNSDSVIANVDGTPISTTTFNSVMQMNINKFSQMMGEPLTGNQIKNFQIHTIALSALINDAVFESEFNKLNFVLDDEVIAIQTKKRIPELYDKNNKLNDLYLKNFLREQKLSIEDIVRIISYETRNNFFNEAFFDINFPQHFTRQVQNYDNQKREISYVMINLDQIEDDNLILQDSSNLKNELEEFYKKNVANYMSKEKRSIEYFILDKNSLNENFSPTDYEIREYYNQNNNLFFENEKRNFVQFNFKSKDEGQNFKEKTNGFDYQQILDYSKKNNIFFTEFENIKANEILEEIAKPLFELKVNEQSNIIETSLANHILILKSIVPSYQKKFEEVTDEIVSTITKIEIDNQYNNLLNQISENIINGESISKISNNNNLKINKIENLTRDFSNFEISEKVLFSNLIQTSFSSNKDFVSDVKRIDDNISYVVNVSKIEESKPLIFDEIEETILYDWKNFKKVEKIKLNTEKNSKNIDYINTLSNKFNTKINKLTLMKNSNELPSLILQEIFKAEKNININSNINENLYIFKVDDIIIQESLKIDEDISMKSDLRNAFGQELFKNKKISTNDSLISALIEQY